MVPLDRPEPLVLRELMVLLALRVQQVPQEARAQSGSQEQPELPDWQEALQLFLTAPVFRYHLQRLQEDLLVHRALSASAALHQVSAL